MSETSFARFVRTHSRLEGPAGILGGLYRAIDSQRRASNPQYVPEALSIDELLTASPPAGRALVAGALAELLHHFIGQLPSGSNWPEAPPIRQEAAQPVTRPSLVTDMAGHADATALEAHAARSRAGLVKGIPAPAVVERVYRESAQT